MQIRVNWQLVRQIMEISLRKKYSVAFMCGFIMVITFVQLFSSSEYNPPSQNHYSSDNAAHIEELASATVRLRRILNGMAGTKGRDKNDGHWYKSPKPFELYAYSAFYDNRHSLGTLPVLRIVAVSEYVNSKKLFCVLYYKEKTAPVLGKLVAIDIGAGVIRHGKGFREYILTCPLDNEDIPTNVSIALTLNSAPEWSMPVEVAAAPLVKEDFVMCVSVSYWKMDPYRIVEWLEMHKLLGISKVVVYNNSLNAEAARVFQYYDRLGFVDFRQSWSFVRDPGEHTIHMHMSPVINDCMYRNMYTAKRIVVTDFDELIIPRKEYGYREMLRKVDKDQDETSNPIRHYMFRNAYFFFDIPHKDTSVSRHLTTQRYRWRLPPSIYGYATKSIISPLACVNMHNHFCWGSTKLYDKIGLTVDVDPSYALSQHYKKCHLDRVERPGACKVQIEDRAVSDDVMLRYKNDLIPRVSSQLEKLKLPPL